MPKRPDLVENEDAVLTNLQKVILRTAGKDGVYVLKTSADGDAADDLVRQGLARRGYLNPSFLFLTITGKRLARALQ